MYRSLANLTFSLKAQIGQHFLNVLLYKKDLLIKIPVCMDLNDNCKTVVMTLSPLSRHLRVQDMVLNDFKQISSESQYFSFLYVRFSINE
jgi:hypothetical protein